MTSYEQERERTEHNQDSPSASAEPIAAEPAHYPDEPVETSHDASGEPGTPATEDVAPPRQPADQPSLHSAPEPSPAADQAAKQPVPPGPEACIELFHSHAFTYVSGILQSFGEEFHHVSFDGLEDAEMLSDEYENSRFHVTYCLREQRRDELRVRYGPISGSKHSDAELLALARQLAHLLGGGTNLRLVDNRNRRR